MFNFAFLSTMIRRVTTNRDSLSTGANRIVDISRTVASIIVLRWETRFSTVRKADQQIAVIAPFGSSLSVTTRLQWSHPLYLPTSAMPTARIPLSLFVTRYAARSRIIWQLETRGSPLEKESSGAENGRSNAIARIHDHVAIARWQKHCQCHCDCRSVRLCSK